LLAVAVAWPLWNRYTLRRAEAELRAAGFVIYSTPSMLDMIAGDPTLLLKPAQLLNPNIWRSETFVDMEDGQVISHLRDLDSVASALRRVQPTTVILFNCYALQNVDGLRGMTKLRDLNLIGCTALQNVDGLRDLTGLRRVELSVCTHLKDIGALHSLTGLKKLDLLECRAIPADSLRALRFALPNAFISFPDGTASGAP
jgi:hypothetical protein